MSWLIWAIAISASTAYLMYIHDQLWKTAKRNNEIGFTFGFVLAIFITSGTPLLTGLVAGYFADPLPPLFCPGDSINAKDYWRQGVCL